MNACNRKGSRVIQAIPYLYLVAMIVVYPIFFVEPLWPRASWLAYMREFTNFVPITGMMTAIGNVVRTGRIVYLRGYLLHLLCMVPVGMYYGQAMAQVNLRAAKPLLVRYGIALTVLYAIRVSTRMGTFDVDDILLNLAGMYLGILCTRIWKK